MSALQDHQVTTTPLCDALPDGVAVERAGRRILPDLMTGPFVAKDRDLVLAFTVPGDPCAKQRPRWSRRSKTIYTPTETRAREATIATLAKHAYRELVVDPLALFSLRAGFYLATNQARDVDNMLKLVSDALKGVVWEDDRQVAEMFGFKVPADNPSEARTEVAVVRLPGMMAYTFGRCLVCQRAYRLYPSWRYRAYCSRQCWAVSTRRRVTVPCANCQKVFEIQQHRVVANKRHFCSSVCKRAFGSEEIRCANCDRPFRIQVSAKRRRPIPTCSRPCATTLSWKQRRQNA